MKVSRVIIYSVMVLLSMNLFNCKKTEAVLSFYYLGTLELRLISKIAPKYDATSSMIDVKIDRNGEMEIGSGKLEYEVTEIIENVLKIYHKGNFSIAPKQFRPMTKNYDVIEIKENTTISVHIKTWVLKNGVWEKTLDQVVPQTWNGGLTFGLAEATTGGSICEVKTDYGSATWTLHLTQSI